MVVFDNTSDKTEFVWSSDLEKKKKCGDHRNISPNQLKHAGDPPRGMAPTYFLSKHHTSLQAVAGHARSVSLLCALRWPFKWLPAGHHSRSCHGFRGGLEISISVTMGPTHHWASRSSSCTSILGLQGDSLGKLAVAHTASQPPLAAGHQPASCLVGGRLG